MGRTLPLLFAAALCACSSDAAEPDAPMSDGSGSGVDGTQTFNAMIRPLVVGCVGCHSSGSNEPNLTSYLALGAKYKVKPGATNVLVTKADSSNGIHFGYAYLDIDGKRIVARWIDSL